MHPVLATVSPALLRALVAALFVLVPVSVALTRAPALARRLTPTAWPARIARAIDAVAWVLAALALGLFSYAAPWHGASASVTTFARALVSPSVWSGPWLALPLYAYGAMLTVSLVAGFALTVSLAVRRGIVRARAVECYLLTALAAVVGARVLYVLTNLAEFRDTQTHRLLLAPMFALRNGGLVAYGGFLFGAVASALYAKRAGFALRGWADAAAPSIALGLGLTRVGCYLYGCDFGRVLNPTAPPALRLAGTFPRWGDGTGSPAWYQHVDAGFASTEALCYERFHGAFDAVSGLCRLDPSSAHSAAVHPTQLYESALGFALFAMLIALRNRRAFAGQLALTLFAVYGIARAGLERLRGDADRGTLAGASTSQALGLVTGVACLAALAWLFRDARRRARDASAAP